MIKMKYVLIFIMLTGCFACQKQDFEITNLSGEKIIALGHGGMGFSSTYPTNTFESIRQCLSLGLNGSEIDVQLTKDNVLVAFHDEKLEDKTNMKGFIHEYTWLELQDAYYTHLPYLDYRIVSLDQVFSSLSNPSDFQFMFDCKFFASQPISEDFRNAYMDAIIQLVEKFNMEEKLFIESSYELFLSEFKQRKPNYLFFFSGSTFDFVLQRAIDLNLTGINIDYKNISNEQVEQAHQANKKVSVSFVHYHSDNINAIKKRVDIIQSDAPRSLVRLLNQ